MNETTSISRRAAIGGLAAAGIGFALFGPKGRGLDLARGRVVIDYWEKWTGHEGRGMQEIVDAFNASQERIFVRYFSMSAIDQKAMTAIAGASPPDVCGLWNYNIPFFAEAGAILPLDDLAREHGVRVENYALGLRPIMMHRGKMWATINTGGTLAMYYNKALFREVGLDPEQPPRTIDELDAAAERLSIVGNDGRVRRVGFLHVEPGWWSWLWGYHFGGTLYDAEQDRAMIASAQNVAAYEWQQSYPARLGVRNVQEFRSGNGVYDSAENPFLSGRVAIEIQGPWLANVINAYAPGLDYGVAPFPVPADLHHPDEPVGLIDTDVLVIPKGAKRPEASMEFIAYTQRQDNVERLSRVHCKNSPLAESSEEFLATHPNKGVRMHDAIAKSPRSFRFPKTRAWPQIKDNFDQTAERIWTMRGTPGEELRRVEGLAQEFLDRAADQRRRRGEG